MKTAILPAQVTNLEDKITANLSLTQVMLMVIPIFLAALVFAFLPPFLSYSSFKLVLLIIVSSLILSLAVRIKQQLVLHWVAIIGAYVYRPKKYLLSYHDLNHHECLDEVNNNLLLMDIELETIEDKPLTCHELEVSDFMTFESTYQAKDLIFYPDEKGNIYATIVE